jgi:hypothetical protein
MVFVIVTIINVVVKLENIHQFIEATIENLPIAAQNRE